MVKNFTLHLHLSVIPKLSIPEQRTLKLGNKTIFIYKRINKKITILPLRLFLLGNNFLQVL